jgi:conjugative transposon TraN protein
MRHITLIVLLAFMGFGTKAQEYRKIEIGLTTTVHLIFPDNIKNFDVGLGNVGDMPDILVEQAGTNRLKLAAGIENFTTTNLFVETEGGYYNFILAYSEKPVQLIINIGTGDANIKKTSQQESAAATKKETPESPYLAKCATVIEKQETSFIYANNSLGIDFSIENIYVDHDKLYFKFSLKNKSNVKYEIGYLGFVIQGKSKGKREGVVSDELLQPVYTFQEFTELAPSENKKIITVFDKFTLDKNKRLIISLWEKKGERKIDVVVTPWQIVKAKDL